MFSLKSTCKRLGSIPYLLIPVVLATWLYAPALFYGKTQIHGDSIVHSLSVIEFNRKMLHEGISPLWTDLLYGGHPYFAEGQGGFLNPLNLVVALFFNPVTGQNIYHWLSMIAGALGMYLLCRHFRCSREASTFGTLAVIFSVYWLHSHHNITISGALCWIPWAFLCLERWIENPTGKSALWLALTVSLLIFSGYPQAFHGAIIYMAISLIPTLFSGYVGRRANNSLKQYFITGLAAITVCVSVTAVQWLPLLELTTWSHRSGGIDILFPGSLPIYLNGFLFTFFGTEPNTLSFGVTGSVLVCYFASLSLTQQPKHRMIGHIMASVFLITLGLEYATPLFRHLIKYSLVPGLQYFRGVHLYLGISIIGLGLLGSFAIDQIQRRSGSPACAMRETLTFLTIGSVWFLTWGGLVLWLKPDDVPKITYASVIAAYIILIVFTFINKLSLFGYAVLILIVVEIMVLRISPFPFVEPKLLEKPLLVRHIQGNGLNRDYKFMDISVMGGLVFINPWSSKLESAVQNAVAQAIPSTNVLWDIPSIDANLALPLARRALIRPQLEAEIFGKSAALPGARIIDYLGIRFISANTILQTAGLQPLFTDSIIIMENKYALPRIQTFTRYEMVNSAEDALRRLEQSKEAILILEPPIDKSTVIKSLPASTAVNNAKALEMSPVKLTNDRYKFEVKAAKPAWLFIADANYPGWQAKIDGQPTPVYSAQVLGKAVLVPAGNHQIIVAYKPRSFTIGACLFLIPSFVLMILGIRQIGKRNFPA